ncbi:MAG: cytochrome c biogenesis protein CcsA [Proteobacteria bacterium]|nr:cytochrome c biogenesis protein CcsA [Pseudomonadota bacterium]
MKLQTITGILAIIGLTLMLMIVFLWSPLESSMGMVQKIMYIHVPSAWTSFLAITVAFVFSILYLWKRYELFDVIALSSVEIGVIFCGLALLTGSIWAKPTWNTYWTWDARLTTTLILFLIFSGYLLLRRFSEFGEQQARLSAVVAIIGFLDIPLIHLSVVWWRTIHQPSTVFSKKPGVIDDQILITLLFSVSVFSIIYLFLLLTRVALEKSSRFYQKELATAQ